MLWYSCVPKDVLCIFATSSLSPYLPDTFPVYLAFFRGIPAMYRQTKNHSALTQNLLYSFNEMLAMCFLCVGLILTTHVLADTSPLLGFVPNEKDGTISVIDLSQDSVIRTIPSQGKLGSKIQAVLIHPDKNKIFVSDAEGSAVLVIEIQSGKVIQKIQVGGGPEGLGLSGDGKWLVACLEEDNAVAIIDTATLKKVGQIATQGKNPEHCEFAPQQDILVTSNEESNDLDIIDLKQKKSIKRIKASGHPRGIGFQPGGKWIVVANESEDLVEIYDHDWNLHKKIQTGKRANGVVVAHDGSRAFVSNGGDGTISVIDLTSLTISASYNVEKRPWNMALTSDDKKLYVANGRSNSISVIDITSGKTLKSIPVGQLPWGIAIMQP